MDNAKSIITTQWGEGGTWAGNIDNLKTIAGLLVDKWQTEWGAGGTWAGIMDNAESIITTQWGEGGTWAGIMDNIKTAVGLVQERFAAKMTDIGQSIQTAIDFVQNLRSAIEGFWNWLAGKIFDIKINLPSLPPWAIPESPIPLHTAMKDFSRFLDNADFDIDMAVNGIEAIGQSMLDRTALAAGPAQISQPFNMYGNVTNGMDEQILKSQVQRWVADAMRRN
jgi:hypothetical protein